MLKGVHERYETPFFIGPQALQSEADRGLSCPADLARPEHREVALDPRDGAVLRPQHLPGRDVGHHRRPGFAAPAPRIAEQAQDLAARAFGARRTYFVTNGTSTANKIVLQALIRPGDIVLLSHDCHKSHHYAVILAGARPVYLDAYPLTPFSMYGGVTLRRRSRQHLLEPWNGPASSIGSRSCSSPTCTFDGHHLRSVAGHGGGAGDQAGHDLRVGRGVVRVRPASRRRSASAPPWRPPNRLPPAMPTRRTARNTPGSRRPPSRKTSVRGPPGRVARPAIGSRVRVYATQSTHKTLTSLRQGSMIHVHDQDFEHRRAERLPRSVHDPYLDLAQLSDPRLARYRAAPGRAGGLRAGRSAASSWP